MSYSDLLKENIIAFDGLDKKALVCVFKYFSNGIIKTTNSKLAKFLKVNISNSEMRIKSGIQKHTHIYEIECGVEDKCNINNKGVVLGVFLICGSISNPNKSYNLEFVFKDEIKMEEFYSVLKNIGFEFNKIKRKLKYIIYTKDSNKIIDFLYYVDAFKFANDVENLKIVREIRSKVKQTMNFEIYNEQRSVSASNKQIKIIYDINNTLGLNNIDSALCEIAMLRLDNENLSLSELGKLCNPPITKSGVNSRFKKLEKIYNSLGDK